MTKRIGVLGCGWLGFPVAEQLVDNGYKVFGTSTSKDKLKSLKAKGIVPFQISLSETGIFGDIDQFLSQIDALIVNVPPKLRGAESENYIEKMKHLLTAIKKNGVGHIIFVSSTSVYGKIEGEVTEETPPIPSTESGKQLLASEQLFIKDEDLKTIVVRFGGLIGPNRHPVTILSKKENPQGGNEPVNLIHLEDCIHLILTVLDRGYWGEIFNGVYPYHPLKKEYYASEAQKRGLPIPVFVDSDKVPSGKIVTSKNYLDKQHTFTTSIES